MSNIGCDLSIYNSTYKRYLQLLEARIDMEIRAQNMYRKFVLHYPQDKDLIKKPFGEPRKIPHDKYLIHALKRRIAEQKKKIAYYVMKCKEVEEYVIRKTQH